MFLTAIVAFVGGAVACGVTLILLWMSRWQLVQRKKRHLDGLSLRLSAGLAKLDQDTAFLQKRLTEYNSRVVSYDEYVQENEQLKRDLQNIDVARRKLQLDREAQRERQEELDARAVELGKRYLKENIRWIGNKLTSANYSSSKTRLQKVIDLCRGIGFDVPPEHEKQYFEDLKDQL